MSLTVDGGEGSSTPTNRTRDRSEPSKWSPSQLTKNVGSGFATAAVQAAILLVSYPIYLKTLGYDVFGLWLILGSILSFSKVGDFGIGIAATKFVAQARGEQKPAAVMQYAVMSLGCLAGCGVVIAVGVVVFADPIIGAFALTGEQALIVRQLLPYIAVLSCAGLLNEGLQAVLAGLGRADLGNYTQVAGRAVHVTTSCWLILHGAQLEGMLIGMSFGVGLVTALTGWCVWKRLPKGGLRRDEWSRDRAQQLVRFGSGVFSGGLIALLFTPVSRLCLARFEGVAVLPVFDIAFRGALQIRNVLEVGFRALMSEGSHLSGIGGSDGHRRIVDIHRRALRVIGCVGFPSYCLLFVLITPLLHLWLGDAYNQAIVPTFQVMLVGTFFSLLSVPAFHLSMGLGRIRACIALHSINTGTALALMLASAIITGSLHPTTMAWCLATGYALSLATMAWLSTDLLTHTSS